MKKTLARRKVKKSFIDSIVLKYLVRKNQNYIELRGKQIAVFANDWIGSNIFVKGVFAKEEIDDLIYIFQIIKIDTNKSTALDIGANIGNHALQFANFFQYVEAYEPNPITYKLLDLNCNDNKNIRCHNFGLGDKEENLTLYENFLNNGASSIYLNERNISYNNHEIKILRIDSFLNSFNNIRLMKIDVEGMEFEVISGTVKTIRTHKPIIAFEQFLTEFKAPAKETKSIDLLRSLGYEIFWLKNNNTQLPWFFRRLKNIYQLCFGDIQNREIITNTKVPPGSYSMLFGVHKNNLKELKL